MSTTLLIQTARRSLALLALAIGAQAVLASAASAFHIPGAAYTGGTSAGGTVNFNVSADGQSISQIGFTDPGSACPFSSFNLFQSVPITSNHFTGTASGARVAFNGNFPSKQRAEGTLSGPATTCQLTWSASTTASPAGSEECKDAQAAVKRAKKAVKKADDAKKRKKAKKKLRNAKESAAASC